MKISSQLKVTGDEYEGFYSCGLSMINSRTMTGFKADDEDVQRSDNGLVLSVIKKTDEETGAVHVQTVVENKGTKPCTLEMLDSFVIEDIEGDILHRFTSFWSAEGRHKTDRLSDLNLEYSWSHLAYRIEKYGNTGSMPVRRYFPFAAIEDSRTGKFTAVQLYSPASWQIEVIIRNDEKVTLAGGIADRDFGHFTKTVSPGETVYAPKAVVAEGSSLEEVCDKLVRSQHPAVSPVDDQMGITFNEYCATWGDPSEENMIKIADKLEGHGIQYLVMDSGWYLDKGAFWWEYSGNWDVNKERFPNGLKPVTDYIRSKGMIPGIWYEFETAGMKSRVYNDEEMLIKKDGVPLTVGGRRFLDLEKENVQAFLKKYVIDALKENGFGYIKVDYNDTIGTGCDGPDGMGENLRQKVLKTQDFFRQMVKEIPELVIENCSSGGHRLEPSMMELSSMASFSDAHEIPALPIIAANLHYLVKPSQNQIWAVFRATDSDDRLYYSLCAAFLGRMGLSGDINDLTDAQWKIIDESIAFYKEAADIIKNGSTIVNISEPGSYNDPHGGQLVIRKYKDRALYVYHRFAGSEDIESFMEAHKDKIGKKPGSCIKSFGKAGADFSAEAFISYT